MPSVVRWFERAGQGIQFVRRDRHAVVSWVGSFDFLKKISPDADAKGVQFLAYGEQSFGKVCDFVGCELQAKGFVHHVTYRVELEPAERRRVIRSNGSVRSSCR